MKNFRLPALLLLGITAFIFVIKFRTITTSNNKTTPTYQPVATYIPYPGLYTNPSPTPTARPLTFSEMNGRYGPCINLPTIIYHHIENADVAKAGGFTSLNVTITTFKTHLQYLKDKGYNIVGPDAVINFFDHATIPPAKSVMLTFDDGYLDFYVNAYPLLKDFGYKAVMFIPTGLMDNNRFLFWSQISEMASSGLIYFANHTWSHKSTVGPVAEVEKEIDLADSQLRDHGLNSLKVFAYPYGTPSGAGITYLSKIGYNLAYTTRPGSVLCKKNRLSLPRIRVGNTPLSNYF